MNLAKLIRPDEWHRTRFHTERGEFMPIRSFATVLLSVWDRAWSRTRQEPWMTRPAVRFLDALIEPAWKVFEFGSGYSTVWLAQRCASVTSVEHDPDWHKRLSDELVAKHVTNCILRLEPLETFPSLLSGNSGFDLIIIDCQDLRGERFLCLDAARDHVHQGRYVVFDDSDRSEYRQADDLFAGWHVRRFVGWKPFPLHAVETSIYQRPNR
jgi:predicted O-methyltransferase YrrM